jgi:hypothetical protein
MYGYQGVCPCTNEDTFDRLITTTDIPTSSPTEFSTQISCTSYATDVYIHKGCTGGKAGYATDADCPSGACAKGDGYYCDEGNGVSVWSPYSGGFDDSQICDNCTSGISFDDSYGAWCCDEYYPWQTTK